MHAPAKAPGAPHASVKVGNVTVPIFKWGDGRFWVRWREDGEPKKRPFKRLDKAKALARVVATRLDNGLPSLADLTATDREIYRHCCKIAAELGFTLTTAMEELKRQRLNAPAARVTIEDFRRKFMDAKADQKLSPRYMRGLRTDLDQFAQAFPGKCLHEITPEDIAVYLRGLKVGLRRRNNVRDELVTFFTAAKNADHLPYDRATAAERVARIELDDWIPTTYTPAEMQLLLEHVSPEWKPWLCIAAFAGMRSEEIACVKHPKRGEPRQLMWADFKWERRKIEVPAVITKDRRRRLVPISDQLLAWLEPWTTAHGPVCPSHRLNADKTRLVKDRYDREIDRLKVVSGVPWKNDALRHSFCSYWLSLNPDYNELAKRVGNSPAILKKHYEDVKFPDEAEAWFGILPDRPGNVVQLPIGLTFSAP